jgi:hypothetical protein
MGRRAGRYASLFLAVVLTAPLFAEKSQKPPAGGPPSNVGVVSFTVELPADALRVWAVPAGDDGQAPITRLALDVPGAFSIGAPGEALLPAVQKLVALPRGAKVSQLTITPTATQTIGGAALLEWAQPDRPGQFKETRDWIEPSVTIVGNEIVFYGASSAIPPVSHYLKTDVWPAETTTINATFGGSAANVVQVDVAPVQWYPQNQTLVYNLKQTVEVHYELPKQQPHFKPTLADTVIVEDLRTTVVNPDLLPPFEIPFLKKIDAPYLIITDNYHWNEDKTRGVALTGDMVAEFQRLADWKTRKGLRAKVVTVSQIVSGEFGSFSRDAIDLQETIREFLKHARSRWNTYWVLLGGDETVIPPRVVLSNGYVNAEHALLMVPEEQPPKGRGHFHADTESVRLQYAGPRDRYLASDQLIYAARDSRAFSYVGWPRTGNPGWGWATDDTYRFPSVLPTGHIVIKAPRNQIEGTHFYLDLHENRIPTDLYYASVDDPLYDGPGRDWDANGDGNYGQHFGGQTLDGVSFEPDLAVGRIPSTSAAGARRWVDRTLAYEKGNFNASFPKKLLLVGDNWGATGAAASYIPSYMDLTAGKYQIDVNREGGFSRARVRFEGAIHEPSDWVLVFSKASEQFTIAFDRNASETREGYYYNTDETFSTRSEFEIEIFGIRFYLPLATRYVSVYAPHDRIDQGKFFFDNLEPDGVIEHKERVGSLLMTSHPALTDVKRLYTDWYDFPGGGDPSIALSPYSLGNALRDGQNLVSMAGHGLPAGCCALTAWDRISFNSSGVMYVDSCYTGRFTAPTRSLAENMTVGESEGVAAYFGNTAMSWIGLGNDIEAAFWERLRLADTLASLHHTKATFQRNDSNLWANYAMTMFGDPEMRVWRQAPLELSAEVPETITPGTRLRVRLTSPGGEPLTFVRVAMTGRNLFETTVTDLNGTATFPPVVSPGTVHVVAAPSGYRPAEHEVTVAP